MAVGARGGGTDEMKVVLFCGGLGLRIRDSDHVPKPMVTLGYRPLIWHVMKYYAHYGYKDFILCLGYRGDVLKQYFLDYNEALSNNFVLGAAIEAMGEAFSLERKYGVMPQVLFDVMTDALFASPAYKIYGKIIVDESYDKAGFKTLQGLKDLNLVLAAADQARVPMPSANVVRDRLLGAIAHGDGDKDWAVMAREQNRASGIE